MITTKTVLFTTIFFLNAHALSAPRIDELSWQLLEATEFADIERMTLLINEGADVNFFEEKYGQPYRGGSVLFWAIASKSVEAVKLLLDAGADPNQWFQLAIIRSYPLSFAICMHAPIEMIKDLIAAGADVNAENLFPLDLVKYYYPTQLELAKAVYYPEAVELLQQAGAK